MTRSAISRRVADGRLHREFPGVYRLGPDVGVPLQRETAAVLYCNGDGVLGEASAAYLWGWIEEPPATPVLTTTRDIRVPGLTVHRAINIGEDDVRLRDGLPVTSPVLTLIDLAGDDRLEEAFATAAFRGHITRGEVERASQRWPYKRGIARLRRLAADAAVGIDTRTRALSERRLRKLLAAADLPRAISNARVLGYEVDLYWPHARLIVEFDGHEFHGDRRAFERDRRRDQRLIAAGYRVIRITWRQLEEEPYAVIARIAQALAWAAAA